MPMSVTLQAVCRRCRPRRTTVRLSLESLELRSLPSTNGWPGLLQPVSEVQSNDTLDQFQDLGNLTLLGRGEATGTVDGSAGAADVDWYGFTLDQPARVAVTTLDQQGGSPLVSTLSLYNSDPDNFNDLYDPLFHR